MLLSLFLLLKGNKTWTTAVNIVQGVQSSGRFTLILSYMSASSVRVVISVESKTAQVTLNSCAQHCYFNLSVVLGEMSLNGSVMVNVTYGASVSQFTPISVVALPQEFYHPMLLRNSTMEDFLANCSIVDNDMGVGSEREEFCLAQVFSITVNYLDRALGKFIPFHWFLSVLKIWCIQNLKFQIIWVLHTGA